MFFRPKKGFVTVSIRLRKSEQDTVGISAVLARRVDAFREIEVWLRPVWGFPRKLRPRDYSVVMLTSGCFGRDYAGITVYLSPAIAELVRLLPEGTRLSLCFRALPKGSGRVTVRARRPSDCAKSTPKVKKSPCIS